VYTYKAKVVYIVDGDTMDVVIDLGFNATIKIRVRIMGVDTPEVFRPKSEGEAVHGAAASRRAKELLLNKDVIIQTFKDADIYNRYSAKITLPDGKDFSGIMLEEGYQKKEKY
jgi:micrococcal nuclease